MNYIGTWTLFKKESMRFLKIYNQTLFAPVITSLLFFAVFELSLGSHVPTVNGVPFAEFMASGLIIMTVVQQAFTNTASSLVMGKVIGMVVDYLMPPLSAFEVVIAMVGASVLRGIGVAILGTIALSLFVPLNIEHPFIALFYLLAASILLALLGLLTGILSDSFEHMAAVSSYVITPLAFLSGTFYSVQNLPPFWQAVAHANPFFFMIDGFRYGMTGATDGSLLLGAGVLCGTILVVGYAVYKLFAMGFRLKT